jgi:asparaginyl-tRNA synthetase
MRIADMEELIAAYKREGIDPEPYYWFTDQRKYGTCEHGGYGLGVEVRAFYDLRILGNLNGQQRFLAWLADRYTVRECSLYPRYKSYIRVPNGPELKLLVRWPGRATP